MVHAAQGNEAADEDAEAAAEKSVLITKDHDCKLARKMRNY